MALSKTGSWYESRDRKTDYNVQNRLEGSVKKEENRDRNQKIEVENGRRNIEREVKIWIQVIQGEKY